MMVKNKSAWAFRHPFGEVTPIVSHAREALLVGFPSDSPRDGPHVHARLTPRAPRAKLPTRIVWLQRYEGGLRFTL